MYHIDLTFIPAGVVFAAYLFGVVDFETAVVTLLLFTAVYSGPP